MEYNTSLKLIINQLSISTDNFYDYLYSNEVTAALRHSPKVLNILKENVKQTLKLVNMVVGSILSSESYKEDERKRMEEMFRAWQEKAFLTEKKSPVITEDVEKESGIFNITQEDLKKMPKTIKGKFFIQGFSVCWRKRQTGQSSYSYQVRFNRNGIEINFTEKRKEDLKPRFLKELKTKLEKQKDETAPGIPIDFDGFTLYYFENFRKPKVTEYTYRIDLQKYHSHIKPILGKMYIRDITPVHCKHVLDNLLNAGYERLAQCAYSLMNVTFKSAIAHHLISRNPMDIVLPVNHECEHGMSLTHEEERALLLFVKGTPYELMFAVALYTGLRPNEYKTARIEGNFIIAVNSKRKTKKVEYKKIPISPMLRPYLEDVTEIQFYRVEHLRAKMKEVLPNHKLYDLRTTFYTRCQECGVAEVARKEFVGHSLGTLGNTYTDLSDAFLLNEAEKLKY